MKDLPIYLNDHLAGSIGALEMLDDVIDRQKGEPLEAFLKNLRTDIASDQQELRSLMEKLGVEESAVRKAGAWVAEKFSRAKLRIGDSGEPNLALMQSLESLALGKQSLWRTLAAIADTAPVLSGFDFARLEKRAADQFECVETEALAIAQKIFPPDLRDSKK
jgi:hypothetical protein